MLAGRGVDVVGISWLFLELFCGENIMGVRHGHGLLDGLHDLGCFGKCIQVLCFVFDYIHISTYLYILIDSSKSCGWLKNR